MIQDESTQPRSSSAVWILSASDGRRMFSDSLTVWWLGKGQNKERSVLEQQLWFLFGDPKGAVELAQKGIILLIVPKVAPSKCVIRACLLAIPMDSQVDKR